MNDNILYHYTSIETLLKVAATSEMWASSSQYLNDVLELDFFIDRVRKRIPTFIQVNDLSNADRHIFSEILAENGVTFERKPFLISFSAQADSLPQWRAYCHEGNGVSIGFRSDCLRRATLADSTPNHGFYSLEAMPTINLFPVQYPSETDHANVDGVIDTCFSLAREKIVSFMKGTVSDSDQERLFDFAIRGFAPAFKHQSFSAEEEFRLVVSPPGEARSIVRFRTLKSTLLPYIRVSIPRSKEGHPDRVDADDPLLSLAGRWHFIDHVVIGPSPNPVLTKQALDAFFKGLHMAVEVRTTSIPYRSWL